MAEQIEWCWEYLLVVLHQNGGEGLLDWPFIGNYGYHAKVKMITIYHDGKRCDSTTPHFLQ